MSVNKISTLSLLGAWIRDHVNGIVYLGSTTDDLIVGGNSTEFVSGTELKMFFDQSKGSFRAGRVTNTSWNTANVGNNSAAFGQNCQAADQSFAAGYASLATGAYAVALGQQTTASGTQAVALGYGGVASGTASMVTGMFSGSTRRTQQSRGAGTFAAVGDAQANSFVAIKSTTSATPAIMTFDINTATATLTGADTNVLTIPVSRVHRFTLNVAARRSDSTSDAGGWTIRGTVVRGASGSATFISTPSVESDLTAGAISGAWAVAVSINTTDSTNNYLAITVTGQASATIRWMADIQTVEVG